MTTLIKSYLATLLIVGGLLGATYLVFAAGSTTSVSVGNAAPTVTNVTISPSPIVLSENATTGVVINADITDSNGCSDVFASGSVTAALYRSGVAATSTCTANDLNCYRPISFTTSTSGNACTGGADTSFTASATVPVWYFANATDASSTAFSAQFWAAWVKAVDGTNSSSSATTTAQVDISTLAAMRVTAAIAYGSVPAGTDTAGTNQTATTTNTGNSRINVEISGTDMTYLSNTIVAAQQKYATSSVTYASLSYTLSTSPVTLTVNIGIAQTSSTPTTSSTYWGIAVPGGTASGTYTGTNTFNAVWVSTP